MVIGIGCWRRIRGFVVFFFCFLLRSESTTATGFRRLALLHFRRLHRCGIDHDDLLSVIQPLSLSLSLFLPIEDGGRLITVSDKINALFF